MPASAANSRRKAPTGSKATTATLPRRGAGRSGASEKKTDRGVTGSASRTTSMKLPEALKAQIDHIARAEGLSPHAFMLKTLSDAANRAYLREQFQNDAQEALREMKASGMGHELCDVRDYFAKLAVYRAGKGRKPRKPVLTKIV